MPNANLNLTVDTRPSYLWFYLLTAAWAPTWFERRLKSAKFWLFCLDWKMQPLSVETQPSNQNAAYSELRLHNQSVRGNKQTIRWCSPPCSTRVTINQLSRSSRILASVLELSQDGLAQCLSQKSSRTHNLELYNLSELLNCQSCQNSITLDWT